MMSTNFPRAAQQAASIYPIDTPDRSSPPCSIVQNRKHPEETCNALTSEGKIKKNRKQLEETCTPSYLIRS